MSETLRLRFIAIASLSVFIVLFSFLVTINLWNYSNMKENADRTLTLIAENNGVFPKIHKEKPVERIPENRMPTESKKIDGRPRDFSPEDPFATRYFSVTLNAAMEQTSINLNSIAAISLEEAAAMVDTVAKKGKASGFFG